MRLRSATANNPDESEEVFTTEMPSVAVISAPPMGLEVHRHMARREKAKEPAYINEGRATHTQRNALALIDEERQYRSKRSLD